MPEFEIVSVNEAQLRTIRGRQGRYMNEYAGYIQQLSQGKAGKLQVTENEKPATIRRRLGVVAKALGTKLVIKRSGQDLYFWRENGTEEQPKRRGGRRRCRQEQTITLDQPFRRSEQFDQGEIGESELD
jgi:hypothetical protein